MNCKNSSGIPNAWGVLFRSCLAYWPERFTGPICKPLLGVLILNLDPETPSLSNLPYDPICSATSHLPLAAVAVSYAFAINALVMSVNKDLGLCATALRTRLPSFVRQIVWLVSCFLVRHNCNAPIQSLVGLPCRILK